MKKKRRTIYTTAAITIIAIAIAGITGKMLLGKAAIDNHKICLYIDENDNADSITSHITSQMNTMAAGGWKLMNALYKIEKPKTGYYEIEPDISTIKAYNRVKNGLQTPIRLIINNARTTAQLSGKLASQLMLDSAKIYTALGDSSICAKYGYNPQTIIAMFIPNTYEVYWNTDINKLLDRMNKEYNVFWNESRLNKAKEIGMTPLEVSILASIVEEETAVNDEKPAIAGLYINRLNKGMPLQADPTVKFAIGDFTLKRILKTHLETDSPYNTYKVTGLPPGPIRMPSIAGLNSVLNYEKNDYLYMCAKEDFSGRHNFATTMQQHLANARKYQKALNMRGIK